MRRSKPAPTNDFFPGFTDIVEIGVGSLATVYRARETGTNRQVALKLLNVRDASPRALESFERESIALGAVSSHPNIVTLYRSFRAADQRPVLVLELCRGSIGDRMRGGAGLPVAEVVALGIKIAGALETAHRAEILHRDVKPQNILMTEFGEPALADFGVAMLQSSTQTTAGLFDFTTLHAAPELLEGGETSAATDVYELASSLYQLIAGRAAFRAYDGESPASVILRILRDPVQPLVNTQAPALLSDLLVYAMSKDKASRPPTAAEFAAELASVEVDQQWPRTQFLIRDASGGTAGLPSISRIPDPSRRGVPALPPEPPASPFGAPPVPAPATSFPLTVSPPVQQQYLPPVPAPVMPAEPPAAAVPAGPVDDGWSTPTVSGHRLDEDDAPAETPIEPPPGPDASATNDRVVVERQVIERLVFDAGPAAGDVWSDVSLVESHSDGGDVPARPDEVAAVDDVVPLDVWAPPPPPEVIDAEVPRLRTPETRMVPLADHASLLGSVTTPDDAAAVRLEAERVEAERVEAERVEAERLERARFDAERVEAERLEAERVAAERSAAAVIASVDQAAVPRAPEPAPEAPEPEAGPDSAAPVTAEHVAVTAPESADDLASIWGSVDDPPSVPRTAPAQQSPPDPTTRIADGSDPMVQSPAVDAPPSSGSIEPEHLEPELENPLPFVPWRGAAAEPDPFDTGEHRVDPAGPLAGHDAPPPQQYPIPPAGMPDESAPVEQGTGTVPTWAFRAAVQAPAGPMSYGDLSLDPMSLRNKVTFRAGTSALVVDETGLSVRMRMRRSSIPWGEVVGFEPRFDQGGRDGSITVITRSGPVELGATRRRAGDVRYVHALLDAYRQRAAILGTQTR